MAFTVYVPRKEEYEVAVSKNHLTLGKKILESINCKYVELAYNKETNTIRIKPSENGNALVVNQNKIGSKGFFNHFGITKKGKYTAKTEDGIIYIAL